MATNVVKKDGTKQDFDPEKVKKGIALAAEQAGLAEERKNEVVEQVLAVAVQMAEGQEEIAATDIREKVLSELDKVEPSVSAAWRKHDEEKEAS